MQLNDEHKAADMYYLIAAVNSCYKHIQNTTQKIQYLTNDIIQYIDVNPSHNITLLSNETIVKYKHLFSYTPGMPLDTFAHEKDFKQLVCLHSSDMEQIINCITTIDLLHDAFKNKNLTADFVNKYKIELINYVNSMSCYPVNNIHILNCLIDNRQNINWANIYISDIPVPAWFAYKYRHILDSTLSNLWQLPNEFYELDDIPTGFFTNKTLSCSTAAIIKYQCKYNANAVSDEFILEHMNLLDISTLQTRRLTDEFAHKLIALNFETAFYLCANKYISISFINLHWSLIEQYLSDCIHMLPEAIIEQHYDSCKVYFSFSSIQVSIDFYHRHYSDIMLFKHSSIPLEIAIIYNIKNINIYVQTPYSKRKHYISVN